MNFDSNLADISSSLAIDFEPERPVLMLAFSGMAGMLGFSLFEFNNLTSRLKTINKIYLRDKNQVWYHHGLPGAGNNIDGLAAFLRQYTDHHSTKRTVIFGNSGGGYAALLFGHLLEADEVHAFSPKTFITPLRRMIIGDTQFRKQLLSLLFSRHSQSKYFDLKKVLQSSPSQKRNFHLHYSTDHKFDALHAAQLASMAGIYLHPYPHTEHNLIHTLKQSGQLTQIIEQAIRFE